MNLEVNNNHAPALKQRTKKLTLIENILVSVLGCVLFWSENGIKKNKIPKKRKTRMWFYKANENTGRNKTYFSKGQPPPFFSAVWESWKETCSHFLNETNRIKTNNTESKQKRTTKSQN